MASPPWPLTFIAEQCRSRGVFKGAVGIVFSRLIIPPPRQCGCEINWTRILGGHPDCRAGAVFGAGKRTGSGDLRGCGARAVALHRRARDDRAYYSQLAITFSLRIY